MPAPRLLVMEGNSPEARAQHVAAGGSVASKGYAELLQELLPDAVVDMLCFTPADARLAGLITGPGSDPRPIGSEPAPVARQGTAGLVVQGLVAGWGDEPALKGLDLVLPAGGRIAIKPDDFPQFRFRQNDHPAHGPSSR